MNLKRFLEPATHLSWWSDWTVILLGCTIMAVGYVFFINPYDIVPGGLYGIAIVLHKIFPTLQIGSISYILEIPLQILSFWLLGSKMGGRTIVAALVTPLIMNVMSEMAYPNAEALQNLDCTQIANGHLDLSNHLMLTVIIGAAIIGLGCGLVARNRATTGGTDIISMLIQKYLHIRFSKSVLFVDGCVILFGLLVIGLGLGSGAEGSPDKCYLSLYSLISIYIISQVIRLTINGMVNDQIIFIISKNDKKMEGLRQYITKDLDRTATVIKSSGVYTGQDKDMLMLVVPSKEVTGIKQQIRAVAPDAFVIITDAYSTYGEGFQRLPNEGEISPE